MVIPHCSRIMISIHAPSRERHSCFISWYNIYNFNPRSLTGATKLESSYLPLALISIHAPSRERPISRIILFTAHSLFQSTLPHGSDFAFLGEQAVLNISIHAPSRERLLVSTFLLNSSIFQSTLPHGSDLVFDHFQAMCGISIHAPSRERPLVVFHIIAKLYFNPRSLTGATQQLCQSVDYQRYFNPRSLTGATDHYEHPKKG